VTEKEEILGSVVQVRHFDVNPGVCDENISTQDKSQEVDVRRVGFKPIKRGSLSKY